MFACCHKLHVVILLTFYRGYYFLGDIYILLHHIHIDIILPILPSSTTSMAAMLFHCQSHALPFHARLRGDTLCKDMMPRRVPRHYYITAWIMVLAMLLLNIRYIIRANITFVFPRNITMPYLFPRRHGAPYFIIILRPIFSVTHYIIILLSPPYMPFHYPYSLSRKLELEEHCRQ